MVLYSQDANKINLLIKLTVIPDQARTHMIKNIKDVYDPTVVHKHTLVVIKNLRIE